MKKLLVTATLAAMVGTGAVAADSDSMTFNLSGTVDPTCVIASSGFAFVLDGVDAATATLPTGDFFSSVTNAYCNTAGAVLTMTSANGGLVLSSAPPTPIGDFFGDASEPLPYEATANWAVGDGGPGLILLSTDLTGTTTAQTSAINGSLVVQVDIDPQTTPMIAGSYVDTLTVTIDLTP